MDCAIDGNIADELKNTSGLERGLRLLQAAEGIFKENDNTGTNSNRLDNIQV